MAGYENLLAIVYHAGPSIFGCQALRLRILDMGNSSKHYPLLHDIECPVSKYATLLWFGFSEEGQLCSYDNEGLFRLLHFSSLHWVPVLDFKLRFPAVYNQFWVVGVCESEVLAIELPKNYAVPHPTLKNAVRRLKMNVPFLEQASKDPDSKELTPAQLEETMLRERLRVDQEQYRRDNWEHLKQFRTRYDNEYLLSESIMGNAEIVNKKKEIDKLILNAIRVSLMKDEQEKVFSYMDMLHFSQSLKLCVTLCDQLNMPELSQKIAKFMQDKEQKELMIETYKQGNKSRVDEKSALENRKMFKAAI